ncbi:hypothetical protein BC826DRAFT_974472 [Russula brevipes]|nr:hypothetical protein BC826DRAFT_974472 [Russula brevipes]
MVVDAHSPSSPSQTLADLHLSLDGDSPPIVNGFKPAVFDVHHAGSEDALDPLSRLQQELERTREERDEFATQYRNLLGKLQTMRNTLGNKLKQMRSPVDGGGAARRGALLERGGGARGAGAGRDVTGGLGREQALREARAELERTRTARDDREAEAMAQHVRAEEAPSHSTQPVGSWTRCDRRPRASRCSESRLLREARAELERTRTARDRWEAEAMAQRVCAEEVRITLDATYRELTGAKEACECDAAARYAEAERANNLQAVLQDFQSAKDHNYGKRPEAQAAGPLKPEPSQALWRALRAPRLGRGCQKPEPSLQAQASGW